MNLKTVLNGANVLYFKSSQYHHVSVIHEKSRWVTRQTVSKTRHRVPEKPFNLISFKSCHLLGYSAV
jgi:hypothetical protein